MKRALSMKQRDRVVLPALPLKDPLRRTRGMSTRAPTLPPAKPNPVKDVSCKSLCAYDPEQGTVLLGYQEGTVREVASLSKIANFLTALQIVEDLGLSLEVYLRVTESAGRVQGTSAELMAGAGLTR
jgi:D-alanyl-D-alanine carboxypeptidase